MLHAVDPKSEERRYVIETLELVLARAKAGEFRSVHVFAMQQDGVMIRESGGGYDIFQTIGAMETLKHQLISDGRC
jgi:hypothetical protein